MFQYWFRDIKIYHIKTLDLENVDLKLCSVTEYLGIFILAFWSLASSFLKCFELNKENQVNIIMW